MLICDLHIFPLEPPTTRPVRLEIPSWATRIKLITERGTEKNAIPKGAGEGGYSWRKKIIPKLKEKQ